MLPVNLEHIHTQCLPYVDKGRQTRPDTAGVIMMSPHTQSSLLASCSRGTQRAALSKDWRAARTLALGPEKVLHRSHRLFNSYGVISSGIEAGNQVELSTLSQASRVHMDET